MMQLQSRRSWNSVLIEQNLIFFGFRAQSQEEVSGILYYRLDDVVRKKKKLDSGSFVLSVNKKYCYTSNNYVATVQK